MAATNDDILAELQEIKKLLTPAPAPPPPKGIVNEFRAFIEQYKILGLAVAFIVALYLGNLVKALVGDLILPLIPLPSGKSIETYMVGPFGVGDFAINLVTFLIILVVVFAIVKASEGMNIK